MGKIDAGQKIAGGLARMLKPSQYSVPASVNPRNYYDIMKPERQRFEQFVGNTLDSGGIPDDILKEVRFFGLNSPNAGGKAMWLPRERGITMQEIEYANKIADGGDDQRMLQGWLTHELGHGLDNAGTASQISTPKRGALSFIRDEQDRLRPQHDVLDELVGLDADRTVLGDHLQYPLKAGFAEDDVLVSEILSQLFRGWKGNPDAIMSEAPTTGRLLERAFRPSTSANEMRGNIKGAFGFKYGGLAHG